MMMCSNRFVGLVLLGFLLTVGPVSGELIHHWTLDVDGADAVGGLNGTVQGPVGVPGKVGNGRLFDGQNDSVEFTGFVPPLQGTIVLWMNAAEVQARGRFLGSVDQFEAYVQDGLIANQLFAAGSLPNYINSATTLTANTWYHVALTYDGFSNLQQIYVNGELDAEGMTADDPWGGGNFAFGHRAGQNQQFYNGILDDVRYYDQVLGAAEIEQLMKGSKRLAADPNPSDGATDVRRDTVLGWTPAEVATAHDVYFATSIEDVNNASRTNPLDVLVRRGQSETTYDPDQLDFGKTYYWRIDEVGAAPESAIYQGPVWSFTVEPFSYPIQNVTAMASSATTAKSMTPDKTVDGSGMTDDEHSTDETAMWLSAPLTALPAWIRYEFDDVYKLSELWVWNSNQAIEGFIGFGARDVTVEYSLDGAGWTRLTDMEFARAPGDVGYTPNTTVDLAGVLARFVRLTITSNWSGILPQVGLSEVRFFYIPTKANQPSPPSGDKDVPLDVVLTWRSGREATSHDVYFSDERDAVVDGTAPVENVSTARFEPRGLELGLNYYWKVNEMGDAGSVYEGDVWSLTTIEYMVVDDFESYTDDFEAGEAIWQAWIDGLEDPQNGGSVVGYGEAPFAERRIVHSGRQSMPLFFDNTGSAYSEAERVFETSQDWTQAGVTSLAIHLYGDPNNNAGQLYAKVNGVEVAYDGDPAAFAVASWTRWDIDLASVATNLERVASLAIGLEGGGSGVLYIDDIWLTPPSRALPPAITVAGVESVETTGNDGAVVSINGIAPSDLVLGTTVSDFEKYADHPAADADDFDLGTYASLDESAAITVTFSVPVTTVFIIERGANDQGRLQPLDANGDPIGGVQIFAKRDWFKPGVKINNQDAGAIAITSDAPIFGLTILPPVDDVTGLDPASISAIAAP
jgi:hypothetical protein